MKMHLQLHDFFTFLNRTIFTRTCEGIEPGTVVISEEAVDGLFRPEHRQVYTQHSLTIS